MRRDEFLSRIAGRAGLTDPELAEPIALAVLSALAERLDRHQAAHLFGALPAELGAPFAEAPRGREFDAEELYQRVANRLGVRGGVAVEHTVSVLRTVAEAIPADVLGHLREELGGSIGALLVAPEPIGPPPQVHRRPDATTLAEGHGGSARPLYAARPGLAHTHSVALSDNPHGDTKLSSARGLTQEREGDTLAEGKPGSKRPLSGAR